ncbi:uncharacterized protein TNCT_628441 [Trichonephila clavata]|uniref:Uncharacterized protein n=1 Tax=Trichonephila clavata TaxID=2740835 RepID=A0A8X6K8M1_TRICU|nr:uncharacterized protein TNCT_628441 [Trichonephila clavata]
MNAMQKPFFSPDPIIPSRVKHEPWISVYSEKSEFYTPHDSTSHTNDSCDEESENFTGKWLLFHDKEHVDEETGMTKHDTAWQFIKKLVEDGEIYGAKCSTAWEGQYIARKRKQLGVICCYTNDYTNKQDVKRVADAIRRVYCYPENMLYKTDKDTFAGKYQHIGNKHVTIYKHNVNNQMYERHPFLGKGLNQEIYYFSVVMYIPWPVPSTPQTPSNEVQIVCPSREYLALLKLALSSSSSQTAVGILAMGVLNKADYLFSELETFSEQYLQFNQ